MPDLSFLLKVSRPRFWVYVFGPYIVGLAAGASSRGDLLYLSILAYAIYFLLPANLLIYGVNDIFDYETDKLNPKKADYETLVTPERRVGLVNAILATNLLFIVGAFFLTSTALFSLLAFVLFSVFYSAPPIRAKALPIIDSMFNVLYVFPGIFGYVLISGNFPPYLSVLAAFLWTMAMHAFSAVPDIAADTEAGVETVATFLGPTRTLIFCAVCYLLAALFAFPFLGVFAGLLGMIYLGMMGVALLAPDAAGIFRIYRYFPIVNTAAGFFLFWYAAVQNLYMAV